MRNLVRILRISIGSPWVFGLAPRERAKDQHAKPDHGNSAAEWFPDLAHATLLTLVHDAKRQAL